MMLQKDSMEDILASKDHPPERLQSESSPGSQEARILQSPPLIVNGSNGQGTLHELQSHREVEDLRCVEVS